MKLIGVSEKVFLDRYALKDKKGNSVEKTPEEMWKRVAKAVAQVEKNEKKQKQWEKEFFWAMKNFKYIPGGRILAGAGSGFAVTYYNCFVIPSPKDSRDGILETLKQMVEIMAHGGGVGINLSSLRPRGARVKKVNGFSSGPVNWAELFSTATKDIIQQGGSRRGALMLMLWDWHPDIEEFITVKQDLKRINGANLSLCVSDKFMKAVEEDADWPLVFPDLDNPDYDKIWDGDLEEWLKKGKKVKVYKTVKARRIWDLIAQAAWKSAEPGVVFMERYNKLYNNWYWNRINCVNPCGEEGLPPWGVCNLGSINLSALVKGDGVERKGRFDFKTLKKLVAVAVRFQDNVVDMDPYVFEGIRKTQLEGERRIGVGTMGLGDALIKLHLRYGSKESLKFIDKVYRIIRDVAYETSALMAKEKGAFPKFDKKLFLQGEFIKQLPQNIKKLIEKNGIRNSLLLMQAPTGSTSLMTNTTSGIEPVFEFEFIRKDRLGTHIIRHHLYEKWYQKNEKGLKEGKIKKPEWFVSSNELTPEDHVRVQAAIQKYVDASISKTVNAPKNHTVEDVKKLYTLAYKLGCKGITYFRDGSREGVLERKEEKKEEPKTTSQLPSYIIKPRPLVVHGSTYRIETPVGVAFITINTNGGNPPEPLEVFISVGKAGTDVYAMAEGLGRMISLALRFSSHLSPTVRIKEIIEQLKGIGGARTLGFGKERVRSLPDAVAKVLAMHYHLNSELKNFLENDKKNSQPSLIQQSTQASLIGEEGKNNSFFDICPACGEASLVHEEGCKKCYGCGYSEC
ncbi:MAG: adenosylcobalamin-dependent ribonucleoside-diphosphate reductase [Patescibacteria group bacterium]|nr:adenosylcobalamin-dependent ribonucleoside-diphosphate reductase [Patescibacteria group bacterium]